MKETALPVILLAMAALVQVHVTALIARMMVSLRELCHATVQAGIIYQKMVLSVENATNYVVNVKDLVNTIALSALMGCTWIMPYISALSFVAQELMSVVENASGVTIHANLAMGQRQVTVFYAMIVSYCSMLHASKAALQGITNL